LPPDGRGGSGDEPGRAVNAPKETGPAPDGASGAVGGSSEDTPKMRHSGVSHTKVVHNQLCAFDLRK